MSMAYGGDYGAVTMFYTGKAPLLCIVCASIAGLFAYRQRPYGDFLLKVFVSALLIRILIGSLIFAYHEQDFFGGDAVTYDFLGQFQIGAWAGDNYSQLILKNRASGWGMGYYVGAVYSLIGRNMLAIQLINSVLGAITAPIIFICAQEL